MLRFPRTTAAVAVLLTVAACNTSDKAATSATPIPDVQIPELSLATLQDVTKELSSDAFEGRAPGTPGEEKTVAYIIKKYEEAGLKPGNNGKWTQDVPLVEITGGEPLLQENVYPLMEALLKKGYRVMLETGGALPIDKVPERVIKILDIKCPGSGEEKKNHLENLKLLSPHDEVKFVLLDRADYEWSRDLLRKYDLAPSTQVLFSPVYDKLNLKDLSQWILKDRLAVRLQTQLHKVIWSKDAIGV